MTRDDECVYDSASSFKHMHLCYCLAGRRETTRKPPEEHVKKKKIVSLSKIGKWILCVESEIFGNESHQESSHISDVLL